MPILNLSLFKDSSSFTFPFPSQVLKGGPNSMFEVRVFLGGSRLDFGGDKFKFGMFKVRFPWFGTRNNKCSGYSKFGLFGSVPSLGRTQQFFALTLDSGLDLLSVKTRWFHARSRKLLKFES